MCQKAQAKDRHTAAILWGAIAVLQARKYALLGKSVAMAKNDPNFREVLMLTTGSFTYAYVSHPGELGFDEAHVYISRVLAYYRNQMWQLLPALLILGGVIVYRILTVNSDIARLCYVSIGILHIVVCNIVLKRMLFDKMRAKLAMPTDLTVHELIGWTKAYRYIAQQRQTEFREIILKRLKTVPDVFREDLSLIETATLRSHAENVGRARPEYKKKIMNVLP